MFLKTRNIFHSSRRYVQALYLSGDKTWKNTRILSPVLDYEKRLANRTEIENNINRRGLTSTLNVDDIYAQWELYRTLENKKNDIEQRQKQVKKLMRESSKTQRSKERENTIRKCTLEEQVLNENLDHLIEHHFEVEGKFINSFLSMPNDLSDKTPDQFNVISSNGIPSTETYNHHLNYKDLIDYYNEFTYYLNGNAARFDTLIPFNCVDFFKSNEFVQFSNPDFVKTVLVEGAGFDVNDVFEVQHKHHESHTNLLHLVGNTSMLSYLGFITRLRVYGTKLPVQWISHGRIYNRFGSNEHGLYDSCQSTAVQAFIASDKKQANDKFNETLDLINKFYKTTDIHYRIVEVPANELKMAECYSIRIEMYSPYYKKYIEIGNLSNYSDFISKRLSFVYEKDKKQKICDFPNILSGTICNVTRFIAILLETYDGKIPDHFETNT